MKQLVNSMKLSGLLLVASIMMFALSVQSCRSVRADEKKEVETSVQTMGMDSIASEMKIMTYQAVPMSEVKLEIPMMNLRNLAEGAGYYKKSGQATVGVRASGDTVYIDATCDSLLTRVSYYERQNANLKRVLEAANKKVEETKEIQSSNGKKMLWGMLASFVVGTGTGIAVKAKFF